MEKKKISLKEIGLSKLLVIFAAGVLLILLSMPGLGDKESKKKEYTPPDNIAAGTTVNESPNDYVTAMEKKLEGILKKVEGIGNVEVMLTVKGTSEQKPLKDSPYTQEELNEVDGEGGSRTNRSVKQDENTVLVTNENGRTVPYIIQELEPKIEGVVIVAEGGDDVRIKKEIMEAAEVLFNVPMHKVKVMKMNYEGN